jgi:hypothetical protein
MLSFWELIELNDMESNSFLYNYSNSSNENTASK